MKNVVMYAKVQPAKMYPYSEVAGQNTLMAKQYFRTINSPIALRSRY